MGAIGTIIGNLLAQKAAGKLVGMLASKTAWGGTTAGAAGLWALLPGLAEKDPAAWGNLLFLVVGWIGVLYGRMKA